jgi:RNA polymerase sigma factor (TIGR02999 family)
MSDLTRILSAIEEGDPQAAAQLLPLVYDALRRLAADKLAEEKAGQTLQATALVHEAYLRLVAGEESGEPRWANRRHFFAAAAEAMRRILIENARRKKRHRHGGARQRIDLADEHLVVESAESSEVDLLALDEALGRLAAVDAQAAELVKLRYFGGMTTEQAGAVLGLPERTAYRTWSFARAWLYRSLNSQEESS